MGLLLLFSYRDQLPKILKWKNFLWLKIAEIDIGGEFLVEKNDAGHKTDTFKSKTRFPGVNSRIWWLVPFFWGKFCDVKSPKLEELPDFVSGMLLWV